MFSVANYTVRSRRIGLKMDGPFLDLSSLDNVIHSCVSRVQASVAFAKNK